MTRFLSPKDFCASYGVGRTRLYQLIARGQIEARKAGASTLISVESAEAWAASLPRLQPSVTTAPQDQS